MGEVGKFGAHWVWRAGDLHKWGHWNEQAGAQKQGLRQKRWLGSQEHTAADSKEARVRILGEPLNISVS